LIPLAEIEAHGADRGDGDRPLVRLTDEAPAEIWLKLENLQPIGSFKIRGAGNAALALSREEVSAGLVTTSTGNMAQGVAWMARELGPATVSHRQLVRRSSAVERPAAHRASPGRVVDGIRTHGRTASTAASSPGATARGRERDDRTGLVEDPEKFDAVSRGSGG
jgi:hypothetical protein